jgi:hypothetical protein
MLAALLLAPGLAAGQSPESMPPPGGGAGSAESRSCEDERGLSFTPAGFRKPPRAVAEVQKGFLWIDAEDFRDYGGWLLDTQFVYTMGSAYLIAADLGRPVQDASIRVEVPRAGVYRLWVRAKNWLKEHSPGRFTVLVDGRPSNRVFGAAESADWLWQSAGEFELAKGEAEIVLRDLTGYYGRCDALVLTSDLDYVPPAETEAIRLERSRLTGLSLTPQPGGRYDVVVVGAGAAGSCAAIAAARLGARTALVQNRPVLGGNASIELGVHICGAGPTRGKAASWNRLGASKPVTTCRK